MREHCYMAMGVVATRMKLNQAVSLIHTVSYIRGAYKLSEDFVTP